ncbi:MAG: GGDEF domain-containing protein [Spirochaetia bacterium]|nr:GGDEF domain-containing protein [Spirochaetia bacterium]
MNNFIYSVSTLAATLILVLFLSYSVTSKSENKKGDRAYILLLIWLIVFTLQESIWGFLNFCKKYNTAFFVSSECFHFATSMSGFFWLNYFLEYSGNKLKHSAFYRIAGLCAVFFQIFLVLLNIKFPLIFFISADGNYVTCKYRPLCFFSQYFIYLLIFISCVSNKKSDNIVSRKFAAFLFCVITLIVMGTFQFLFVDYPFYSYSYLFACCIIQLFVITREYDEFQLKEKNILQSKVEKQQEELELSGKKISEQFEILNAMSDIYSYINVIDFEKMIIVRFDSFFHSIKTFELGKEIHSSLNTKLVDHILSEQKEAFLQFTDLNTVQKRMINKNVITAEFLSTVLGWLRVQYIRVNRENANRVVYTVQNIDDEKRREEQLIYISQTDELTKVYNRRFYEQQLSEYSEKSPPKDFVFMLFDLNGLKAVNDSLGHNAGDELIKGVASCLIRTFGNSGQIYRIGGDEFVVMLFADEKKFNAMNDDFNDIISNWSGEFVKGISVSYGYVSTKEFPKMSVHEMSMLADKRMYENKAAYYKNKEKE